jgi:NAD-dependent deacetylase
MSPTADPIAAAATALVRARYAVGFTGAGVSAASGIPTFRSEAGIWARYPVEEYGTAWAFARDAEKVWELLGSLCRDLSQVEPNPAHVALADLESMGRLRAVVTQNVDALHQRAGSRQVIEFHGTAETAHCLMCARLFTGDYHSGWPPAPRCPDCGAIIKPDVVLFGDPIPDHAARRAEEEFSRCDAVLAVGSTLEVAPASWLVSGAAWRGAEVVIVDPQPSPLAREAATVVVDRPAEDALPEIVAAVRDLVS